jgi:hypothetical protein
MKLSEFKKLEESIKEQDFSKSFKNINKVMFYLSIFGHMASIFLAYFLVSKILSGAITDNPILVGISTVILLGGLELLKREIFDKFSLQQIKYGSVKNKDVLPLMLVSMIIVSISFYSSVKGAKEFSSKSKQIDTQVQIDVKKYEDSVNKIYSDKISKLDLQIDENTKKSDEKDKEQTLLASNSKLTSQMRSRIMDLKTQISEIKAQNDQVKKDIENIKKENKQVISDYEAKVKTEGEGKKNENQTNSFFFVIISTLIELMILAGVYFNEYYKYRSYTDFKQKIDKDPNFQKWYNYNSILEVMYPKNYKLNDKLPSGKSIADLAKVNGVILLPKDIADMFKLFASLGILRSGGSNKYLAVSKETAQELLKTHYNIE